MLNDPFLSLFVVIINAAILIVILNYTLSVAKKMQFTRGVSEMLGISLGIAALTFVLVYPIGAPSHRPLSLVIASVRIWSHVLPYVHGVDDAHFLGSENEIENVRVLLHM